MQTPRAFISYSWSSPGHCDLIRSYAERLVSDGVDVILDQWSLSEGQDKYAFMEKMVTDSGITHVLIFSDNQYAAKADERKAGVGTETQIISKEIYDKVDQKKFIPIVCEKQEDGEPFLPVFLKSRIWIDFSTPEAANGNWERLLRVLHGKPINAKPTLGEPPAYLNETGQRPAIPTIGKYGALRDALLNAKPTVDFLRKDFLSAAIKHADSLRIRKNPNVEHIDEKILEDLHKLLPLRDQLVDWLILESSLPLTPYFDDMLVDFLEKVLILKYRPKEVTQWSDTWFDAHGIFIYELFLYIIAILVRANRFLSIRNIFTTHFMLSEVEALGGRDFVSYDEFWSYSQAIDYRNKRLKLNRLSLLADIIKERATHNDIPFQDVMQAELMILLVCLTSDGHQWYPHTLVYSGQGSVRFPFFIRVAQHKYFERLKIITGIQTANELREKFTQGYKTHGVSRWEMTFWTHVRLPERMNMQAWDTIT